MKSIRKPLIIGGMIVALAAPASAFVIPMLPDACAFGTCVQFTQTTALAQLQSLYQQATMLANEAQNLKNIGSVARQAITQNVASILGAASTAASTTVGDTAAKQVLTQASTTANDVAQVDAMAQHANGAQEQAQVSNLYMSTVADEAVKANTMAAEEQVQRKNDTAYEASGLEDLFSGKIGPGQL